MPGKVMIVGYGNQIRGDDAAGLVLAERIAARDERRIHSIAMPQLYPELAHQIAEYDSVIFVDASLEPGDENDVTIRELGKSLTPVLLGHAYSPDEIIGLAKRLYGGHPRSWILTIPGNEFGWKEGLSTATEKALGKAEQIVFRMLEDMKEPD